MKTMGLNSLLILDWLFNEYLLSKLMNEIHSTWKIQSQVMVAGDWTGFLPSVYSRDFFYCSLIHLEVSGQHFLFGNLPVLYVC